MRPADELVGAADSVVTALRPGTDQDWQTTVGTLDWTLRATAEHAAQCMQAYAIQLASQASTHYVAFFSRALEDATPADVLELVEASGRPR